MADGTIQELQVDFAALAKAVNLTIEQAIRYTALRVHNGVIEKTPVDTGRARGSWGLSLDSPGTYELPEGNYGPDGGAQRARGEQQNLDQLNADDPQDVYIFNNLTYIEALENGHSQQAPLGFVAVTLAEVGAESQAQLDAIARENLEK